MVRGSDRAKDADADARYWDAVKARDRGSDGAFVYSVATTGVYCRPSCGARLAKRENVAFHASWREAEAKGFRPCKRCRPNEDSREARYTGAVADACRFIETSEDEPCLAELAARAGLSPSHFHRVFLAVAGVTPKGYVRGHRRKRLRNALKASGSVTAAMYEAGLSSSSRLSAEAPAALGMTPSAFRSGGTDTEMRFAVGACSLGAILVAASDKGVTAILLGDNAETLVRELEDCFPRATLIGGDRAFEALVAKVVGLVEAPATAIGLPLDVRGTAFQQRVWEALRAIPAGTTATYTEIAARIGMPKAVRAVAAACAANRIAVAIPCHRVVRTDGSLAGYRWGVARKRALIARETEVTASRGSRKRR